MGRHFIEDANVERLPVIRGQMTSACLHRREPLVAAGSGSTGSCHFCDFVRSQNNVLAFSVKCSSARRVGVC